MAPATQDDQFKFLISCIRNSNNGRIDFGQVAGECDIISKGAAAKRYERMMKANGIHQSQVQPTAGDSSAPTTPSKQPKSAPAKTAKKRKAAEQDDEEESVVETPKRLRAAKAAVKAEKDMEPAQDKDDAVLEQALSEYNQIKEEEW